MPEIVAGSAFSNAPQDDHKTILGELKDLESKTTEDRDDIKLFTEVAVKTHVNRLTAVTLDDEIKEDFAHQTAQMPRIVASAPRPWFPTSFDGTGVAFNRRRQKGVEITVLSEKTDNSSNLTNVTTQAPTMPSPTAPAPSMKRDEAVDMIAEPVSFGKSIIERKPVQMRLEGNVGVSNTRRGVLVDMESARTLVISTELTMTTWFRIRKV